MLWLLSNNIVSPLGFTTEENYQAVKDGSTALHRYERQWGLPDPFTASLFSAEQTAAFMRQGMTRFESLVTESMERALSAVPFDIGGSDVVMILGTTKGDVEELEADDANYRHLGESARLIANHLGITTVPVVACDACVSGLSALNLANQLLTAGTYRYAVVTGADVQSRFIVSGFQSLKAVSADDCRPFDIERIGLNLGEAAATMVVASSVTMDRHPELKDNCWKIRDVALYNDAYHLSSPSKQAEGAYLALHAVTTDVQTAQLAFINAHGTATMYNDQMESVAIERARLTDVPVNGLKGVYGHTMGAAGVLETILSMAAVDDHTILPTRGFTEIGVSGKIRVTAEPGHTDRQSFVKMISGFGGCNGALLATKENTTSAESETAELQETHRVHITPQSVVVDGHAITTENQGKKLLTELYKRFVGDYPKFYKMDMLSRLGFVASELLLQAEGVERFSPNDNRAVILFNRTSSIDADCTYLASIDGDEGYFPSPSVFVYTLPNIVTGEIAIRNGFHGETSFYVLPERNDELMQAIVRAALKRKTISSVLTGWIDYENESAFEAELSIIKRI